MIKRKETTKLATEIKGILKSIENDCLIIEDCNSGGLETVSLQLFSEFVGEEISIQVSTTSKTEDIIDCSEGIVILKEDEKISDNLL